MKLSLRRLQRGLSLFILLFASHSYAAGLPFNINVLPGTPLPTQVNTGGVVYAYYTIQNNSTSVRSSNYVKWTPANVTQVTTNSNFCGANFTLQPRGTAGDTCTLQLAVSGATAPSPSNSNNLLICYMGGKICAGPGPGAQLNVTAVSGQYGIAVGNYTNTATGNPFIPLVIITQNSGYNWTTALSSANIGSGLPADLLVGNSTNTLQTSFYQAKCSSGGTCIATGDYASSNAGNPYYPNISYSNNNGLTWTSVVDSINSSAYPSNLFPSPNATADDYYPQSTCSGNLCIAVGQYQTTAAGNPMYPFVTMSQNSGLSWSSAVDSTTGNLPGDISTTYTSFTYNVYYAAGCSSSVCIAVGNYITTGGSHYPLITVTQNGGTTWTTTVSSSNAATVMPADFIASTNTRQIFSTATCQGSYCLAAGKYKSATTGFYYPLVVASSNNGTTWLPVIGSSSIGTSLPADLNATTGNANTLVASSCSGSTCVVGGYYLSTSGGVSYPLLIASTNSGQTWSVKVSSASVGTASLPADYTTGTSTKQGIKSVTCTGQLCVAAGYYPAGTAQNVYPLLIVSQDGGNTWSVKLSSSSIGTGLPSNLYTSSTVNNYLEGVSCSGSYCVAAGQYYTSATTYVPLVVVSHDGGSTWLTTVNSTTPSALPTDFVKGLIGSTAAAGGVSIPGGSLVDMLNEKTRSSFDKSKMLESLIH